LKAEFAPRPEKSNPDFTRAMNKMFAGFRAMSLEEKVQYIESRKVIFHPWVEPTEKQERLFR
jgi:hypothetical protein